MRRKTIIQYDEAFSSFLGLMALLWLSALIFLPVTITMWAQTKDTELFIHLIWRILGMAGAIVLIPFCVWKTLQVARAAPKYWNRTLFFLASMAFVDLFRYTAQIIDQWFLDRTFGERETLVGLGISFALGVCFILGQTFWTTSAKVRRAFLMQPRPADAPRPLFAEEEVGKVLRTAIGAGFLTFFAVSAAIGAKILFDDVSAGRDWEKSLAEIASSCPGDELGNYLCFGVQEIEIDEKGEIVGGADAPTTWTILTGEDGTLGVQNNSATSTAMSVVASHFGEERSEVQLYLPLETWRTPARYARTIPDKAHNPSLEEAGLKLRLPGVVCHDQIGQAELTHFVPGEEEKLAGVGFHFEQQCKNGKRIVGRACIQCLGEVASPTPIERGLRTQQAIMLPSPEARTIAPKLLAAVCPRRGDAYACVRAGAGGSITIRGQAIPSLRVETSPESVDVEQREGTYKLTFESGEKRIDIDLRSRRGEYPQLGLYRIGESRSESPYLQLGLRPSASQNGRAESIETGAFILHELEFDVYGRLQSLGASFEMRDSDFGPEIYGRVCYRCDGAAWNLSEAPPFDVAELQTPGVELTLDVLDALCPKPTPGPYSWCLLSETKDRRSSDGQRVGILQPGDLILRTGPGGDQANSRGERLSLETDSRFPGGARGIVSVAAPHKERLQIAFYDDVSLLQGSPLRPGMEKPSGNSGSEGAFEIFHLRRDEAGEIIEVGIDFLRTEGQYTTAGRVCYGCPQ